MNQADDRWTKGPVRSLALPVEAVAADPASAAALLEQALDDGAVIALPAPGDGRPTGLTLFATAFRDHWLAAAGAALQSRLDLPLGATGHPCPARQEPALPACGIEVGKHVSVHILVLLPHDSLIPQPPSLARREARLPHAEHASPTARALRRMRPPGFLRSSRLRFRRSTSTPPCRSSGPSPTTSTSRHEPLAPT